MPVVPPALVWPFWPPLARFCPDYWTSWSPSDRARGNEDSQRSGPRTDPSPEHKKGMGGARLGGPCYQVNGANRQPEKCEESHSFCLHNAESGRESLTGGWSTTWYWQQNSRSTVEGGAHVFFEIESHPLPTSGVSDVSVVSTPEEDDKERPDHASSLS